MQTFALNNFAALCGVLTPKMLSLDLNQKRASIFERKKDYSQLFFDKTQDPF